MAIKWTGKQLEKEDSVGVTDDSNGDLSNGLRQGYELGSLTDGLIAYFPFDGDIEDKSLGNSTTDNTSAGYVSGKVGTDAKDFDGNDDTIELPDNLARVLDNSSEVTISAWINLEANSKRQAFFATDNSSGNVKLIFEILSDNQLRIQANDASGNFAYFDSSNKVNTIGSWTHVVARIEIPSNSVKFFIDGSSASLSRSDSWGGEGLSTGTSGNNSIGNDNNDSNNFDGAMDDFRIYDRALSLPEIKALYQRTSTQQISNQDRLTLGLVGHWPLIEDNTSNAYDFSRRGNDASSVTGTSTAVGLGGAKARRFDGQDDKISAPADGWNSEHTVSMFIKTDDIQNSYFSSTNDYTISNSLQLYYNSASGFLELNEGANTRLQWSDINGKGWAHITWSAGKNGAEAYKNGVSEDTDSNLTNGKFNVYKIGENRNGGNYGKGIIQDVRVYNRVLTKSEIERLASMGGL